MKWHCYRISMLPINNKPLLLTEQKPVPSKILLFYKPENINQKRSYTLFYSESLWYFFHWPAQIAANVSKAKILIRYCVLLWCGAVRCLCEKDMCVRHIWQTNLFLSELYIMVNNRFFSIQCPHTNDNLLVLPREEMTDICNKCVDGNLKNCDISKSINKII
jgi:hypothetical protein